VVILGEVESLLDSTATLRVHQVIKGQAAFGDVKSLQTKLNFAPPVGGLVVAFSEPLDGIAWNWVATSVNETSLAYFARAPNLRQESSKRLRYFAKFLEHPDPLVAEDAYLEFGHAPYDVVVKAADALPMDRLRKWLKNDAVPEVRKGFYGMALGLAKGDADRRANAEVLKQQILAEDDDFRAGFDGVLAGYLLLEGRKGLTLIDRRYLSSADAKVGNVRHALAALRFYAESGKEIPTSEICNAVRHTLRRPEFGDRVIIDLARWQDWSDVTQVAELYQTTDASQGLRQAVIGYLRACPDEEAKAALGRIRTNDPKGVAAAEETLEKLGGLRE
jgi:hypothetical protein